MHRDNCGDLGNRRAEAENFLTISGPLAAITFAPESLMTCAVSSIPLVV